MNFLKKLKEEKEDSYVMVLCDTEYFSLALMPVSIYEKLSDIMVAREDWKNFWESKNIYLSHEEYLVFKNKLFKSYGVRAQISEDNKYVYIVGSLPQEIVSYFREIKLG